MIDGLLDNNFLIKLANDFIAQSGLSIGIYDTDGEPVLKDESFNTSDIIGAVGKLGKNGIENVVDISGAGGRTSAVAMRSLSGELLGVWMVSAPYSDPVPFDKHLSLIENVLSSYLREREDALSASASIKNKDEKSTVLSKELARNAAITEILGRMESEEDFERVAGEILALSGEYLLTSNIFLLQIDKDEDRVGVITEWHAEGKESLLTRLDDTSLAQIPFADGLSYTVSSDSRMPDSFKDFMRAHDISAGIFLPIFLDNVNVMYLCATMFNTPRHWSLSEAGFLSDVRRILSTILAKRIAKNSLASSFAVVESVLENIGCGVMVIRQGDGTILYTNDTFREMFSDMNDKQRFERRIRQTPEKMQQIREYFVEGAGIYVSVALGVIRWVDDSEVRLATVFDISENKEFEKRIEKQANIDELTGIYNRTYFVKELGNLLSKNHAGGAYLCLNIDGFKEINVTTGSDGGDLLLSSIAKFLLKLSGDHARVYRIGADEFAVMITDASKIDPADLSKSIIKRFKAPWQLAYKDCYLTASIGISLFPKDGDDVTGILRTGSIALAEARKRGAGSVCFFAPEMEKSLRSLILLRSFLGDAVENSCNGMATEQVTHVFTVNNAEFDGSLISLFFDAPELGRQAASHFMPIARKQRIVEPIIRWFLHEAAKECRYKNDFGYPEFFMGINIDTIDFLEYDVPAMLSEAIDAQGVNPDRLGLILRGDVQPDCVEVAAKKVDSVKKLGAHVAMAYAGDEIPGMDLSV